MSERETWSGAIDPEEFGGGVPILLNPQVARAGFTSREIHDGNQTWVVRLLLVVIRRRKPPHLVRDTNGEDGAA